VTKELSPKQVLAVQCPTCGAAPGEKCELSIGQPRTSPHRDRSQRIDPSKREKIRASSKKS